MDLLMTVTKIAILFNALRNNVFLLYRTPEKSGQASKSHRYIAMTRPPGLREYIN